MKKICIVSFFLLYGFHSFSQYYFYDDNYYDKDLLWEAGVSAGIMQGSTDVGTKSGAQFSPSSYDWKSAKYSAGGYIGFTYCNMVGVRLEVTAGSIAGDDSHSNNTWVKNRNLNYKSHIYEASLTGILHPLTLTGFDEMPRISPYLMGGIACFSFYPKTYYNGQWISLPSLRTEGQNFVEYRGRKQYSLLQFAIPLGAGLKYELSPLFNFRMEALYRYTFTDYLDDVSTTYIDPALFGKYLRQDDARLAALLSNRSVNHSLSEAGTVRGNAANNDGYFTLNFKLGFVIGRKKIRG